MDAAKVSSLQPLHLVNIFYLFGTPFLALVLGASYLFNHGLPSWPILAFMFIYGLVTSFCITGGYHRYFSHRSYRARRWIEIFYIFFGAAAIQGPLLQWVKDHRRHHRSVDTPEDPYNINQGFFYAHMGWMFRKENPARTAIVPNDLASDKLVLFQSNYYLPVAMIMCFGLPLFVGFLLGDAWGGILWAGLIRVVITNHSTFCINSVAHTLGRRPYDDEQSARDSLVMALIALGEGYHNFHHTFETDYRNGSHWYDWDPTKWLIKFMSFAGWTSNLRVTPSAKVLGALLRTQEGRMLQKGFSQELVLSLKQRVVETQQKWRTLAANYAELKKTLREGSHERLERLRAELKIARVEFKSAWQQWRIYRRLQVAPAI